MLNKNFQNWLNQKGEKNLIKDFKTRVEEIKNFTKPKLNTPLEEGIENTLYYIFVHEIQSYTNLVFFRMYDLASQLLPAIEAKSYTTATLICRALFEAKAMYGFRMIRILERIQAKNWGLVYIEQLNFKMLPSWKEDGDIDWEKVFPALKKFHINDAIRKMAEAEESKTKSKELLEKIMKYYGDMSEICHPTQANRLLYVLDRDKFDIDENKMSNRKVFRDNFSSNHADNKVFPIFLNTMLGFKYVKKLEIDMLNSCLDTLKKNKNDLLKYSRSAQRKKDMENTQPILKKIQEFLDKGMTATEIVEAIVKSGYKSNIK